MTELAPAPFRLIACRDDTRRGLIELDPSLQGIDYLEVVTFPPALNQLELAVHFLEKKTAAGQAALQTMLNDLVADKSLISISGGVRVRGITVGNVTKTGNSLLVDVNDRGDFSTYTLRIHHAALDQTRAEVDFSFKAGCPSRFDCKPCDECPTEPLPEPAIDYMAKDYASFRQALLDYLPTVVPDWQEQHEADLAITVVEALSYVGDLLSYEQDSVANEAYLPTARKRTSVRRHARLVDYRMHDGASALAWIHAKVSTATASGTIPAKTKVLTRLTVPFGPTPPPYPAVLAPQPDDAAKALSLAALVFETIEDAAVSGRLNLIPVHTWSDGACCAPTGTTALDLTGDLAYDQPSGKTAAWRFRPGSHVLFEEIQSPVTGLAADADRSHRQVVTLTKAEPTTDNLTGEPLTRIEWAAEDALSFPFCISVLDEPNTPPRMVGVARGNMFLADHGVTVVESYPQEPAWSEPGIEVGDRAFRFTLRNGPLSRRLPTPAGTPVTELDTDPHDAVPQVELEIGDAAKHAPWDPVPPGESRDGLFAYDGFSTKFVVETDEAGLASLRFGDDIYGAAPPDQARIVATYRIGLGTEGNAGLETLRHLLIDPSAVLPNLAEVRNPLPAWGGADPEPVDRVKQVAPDAFRAVKKRAVTEADYAEMAERHPKVSHARATFRWTGSWLTVFLTIDPKGGIELDEPLRASIRDLVVQYTQTGYDLEIQPPVYVPLDLELFVCAKRGQFRTDVEQAVLDALSDRPGRFFDPDGLTFGQPLYLSALYEAVMAVAGVDSVTATRFSRLRDDDPLPGRPVTAANIDRGFISAQRLEVLQLANDQSRPEQGVLTLTLGGGS